MVSCTNDPLQALARAVEDPPNVILMGLNLPTISGHEMLKKLKASPNLAHIPVIVVASDAEDRRVELVGAEDTLNAPDTDELLAAIVQHCHKSRRVHKAVVLLVSDDEAAKAMIIACLGIERTNLRIVGNIHDAMLVMHAFHPELIIVDQHYHEEDVVRLQHDMRLLPEHFQSMIWQPSELFWDASLGSPRATGMEIGEGVKCEPGDLIDAVRESYLRRCDTNKKKAS